MALLILEEGIMRNIYVKLFGFGLVVQMSFKEKNIYSSGGHSVRRSRIICAILVEGIMRNISVKVF